MRPPPRLTSAQNLSISARQGLSVAKTRVVSTIERQATTTAGISNPLLTIRFSLCQACPQPLPAILRASVHGDRHFFKLRSTATLFDDSAVGATTGRPGEQRHDYAFPPSCIHLYQCVLEVAPGTLSSLTRSTAIAQAIRRSPSLLPEALEFQPICGRADTSKHRIPVRQLRSAPGNTPIRGSNGLRKQR